MPSLIETIKKAALSAFEESKPVAVYYGIVENANPLKIRLDQKRVFTETFLVLSNRVKDYKSTITVNGDTQECIINNALKENDKVVLLRIQGGQKYLVLDRM